MNLKNLDYSLLGCNFIITDNDVVLTSIQLISAWYFRSVATAITKCINVILYQKGENTFGMCNFIGILKC